MDVPFGGGFVLSFRRFALGVGGGVFLTAFEKRYGNMWNLWMCMI